jgi:hypothetical protein
MGKDVTRFKLSIEILNFLLQKSDFVSTPEIQKHLFSLGLLENTLPTGKDRRKLNRVLSFLEAENYIESESISVKGRKPQR